jgi:endo-1,4-beta-xylanase
MNEIERRDMLALLAALPVAGCGFPGWAWGQCGRPKPPASPPAPDDDIARIASAKGMFFGTAIMVQPLLHDPRYRRLIEQTCNFWVHASALQWHELQRTPDSPYDFASADTIMAWGQGAHLPARGHMLVDWNKLPPGMDERIMAATPAQAEGLLRHHVGTIVDHFRGRFRQWNVVNEPVGDGAMRTTSWFKKLGERYIDIAFDVATKRDPGAQLTINQVNIEMDAGWQQRNQDSFLQLVRRMHDRNLPIRAIGIEGHLASRWCVDQKGLDSMMKALASMGIAVFISELDVDDRFLPADPAKRNAAAASLVRDFLDVTLSQPNCQGLVCWGLDDLYHWIPLTGQLARSDHLRQRPTAFDDHFRPKPMWNEIVAAFKRAPGPGKMFVMR